MSVTVRPPAPVMPCAIVVWKSVCIDRSAAREAPARAIQRDRTGRCKIEAARQFQFAAIEDQRTGRVCEWESAPAAELRPHRKRCRPNRCSRQSAPPCRRQSWLRRRCQRCALHRSRHSANSIWRHLVDQEIAAQIVDCWRERARASRVALGSMRMLPLKAELLPVRTSIPAPTVTASGVAPPLAPIAPVSVHTPRPSWSRSGNC